jgi:hypothetical protein
MIKEINRFIKVFDTFFKSWDFYGIELINSKEKVTVSIDNFDYEVPLIEISNPNDLPYTLANLYASFQDDFISNIQSLAGTNLSNYTILNKLIVFDVINDGMTDFYLDVGHSKKMKECIHNKKATIKYRNNKNIIYTIEGHYDCSDLEYYIESDGERFVIDVGFKTNSVFVDNLITGKYYMMDPKDFEEFIFDIKNEDRILFEDPIWDCLSPIVDTKTFIDTNWQFIDVNVFPI